MNDSNASTEGYPIDRDSTSIWKWLAGTVLVVALTIWCGLGANRLWDRDEPRNARCAVEMFERNDWVVPTFNGQLRTHKPILIYWVQMASYAIFGVSDFSARAGSALMASLAVLAVFYLGTNRVGVRYGFWAGVSLATSLMFLVAARAATPDAYLIATSSIGIVFLVQFWNANTQRFGWQAWTGYGFLGLAVLAKGPVGIVLPLAVVAIWSFLQLQMGRSSTTWLSSPDSRFESGWLPFVRSIVARCVRNLCWLMSIKNVKSMLLDGWKVLRRLQVGYGLSVVLLVSVPWYVWVGIRTDGQWLHGFFFEHNLSRALTAMEGHQGGVWFYPVAALVGLFPWSLLCIPISIWSYKSLHQYGGASLTQATYPIDAESSRGQIESPRTSLPKPTPRLGQSIATIASQDRETASLVLLGVIWMAVYIGLFTCAKTKLPSYITPCYPGASLLDRWFLGCLDLGQILRLAATAFRWCLGLLGNGSRHWIGIDLGESNLGNTAFGVECSLGFGIRHRIDHDPCRVPRNSTQTNETRMGCADGIGVLFRWNVFLGGTGDGRSEG